MKISLKMLKDLNKCCDSATQWFYAYYVTGRGYEETTEMNYQDVYNEMIECFDNGFMADNNIDFEFGKIGSVKLLRDLKYSAAAILYYPDRVIYHNEYRMFVAGREYTFADLESALEKKEEIVRNSINRDTLLNRYYVTHINITQNGTEKSYEVLDSCVTIDEVNNDHWYWVQNGYGERFEVYGKKNLLSKVNDIYANEILEMRSLLIIEQKIEDMIDGFAAWIRISEA